MIDEKGERNGKSTNLGDSDIAELLALLALGLSKQEVADLSKRSRTATVSLILDWNHSNFGQREYFEWAVRKLNEISELDSWGFRLRELWRTKEFASNGYAVNSGLVCRLGKDPILRSLIEQDASILEDVIRAEDEVSRTPNGKFTRH